MIHSYSELMNMYLLIQVYDGIYFPCQLRNTLQSLNSGPLNENYISVNFTIITPANTFLSEAVISQLKFTLTVQHDMSV